MMEETLDTASKIILEWQSNDIPSDHCPNTSFFDHHSRTDFLTFIRAVKDLQSSLLFLSSSSSPSPSPSDSKKLSSAHSLLRSAIKRLAREFSALLKVNKPDLLYPPIPPVPEHDITSPSSIDETEIDEFDSDPSLNPNPNFNPAPIHDLKLIADCMLGAGYGKKCIKIYKLTRRSVIEDTASKLGARRLKKSQVEKMDYDVIDIRIREWYSGVTAAVKRLFLGEKILCDHLFSSSYSVPPVKDSCFAEVCKDSALFLMRAPGKLAKHSKRSPERLFKHLDLYEPLAELSPDVEVIFASDLTSAVRSQTEMSMIRVTDAVRMTISDFEASIQNQKDGGKNPLKPGGGVHSLTRYVMNYLLTLVNYTGSLDKILADCPVSLQLPESYFEGESTSSPAGLRFKWLILILMCKLDVKSEVYKDAALSYLFLANNVHYVVEKVTSCELRSVLGEKWVEKHEGKVSQYIANYERMGWGRVMLTLPEDPTVEIGIDKVKECFQKFNAEFTEEYRKQVDWVVHDPKIREEIKETVAKKVGRRYRGMYDKYIEVLRNSRARGTVESVIKFHPQDLDNFLLELLDGPDNVVNDPSTSPMQTNERASWSEVVVPVAEQSRRKRLLLHIRQHLLATT